MVECSLSGALLVGNSSVIWKYSDRKDDVLHMESQSGQFMSFGISIQTFREENAIEICRIFSYDAERYTRSPPAAT